MNMGVSYEPDVDQTREAYPSGVSALEQILTVYLQSKKFHRSPLGYWGHPELGEGRTFTQVIDWQIGREKVGRSS